MQAVFVNVLFLVVALIPFIAADHACDVSQRVSLSQWQCLSKFNFYSTAIVRVYRSVGSVDSNAAYSLKNARAAGFQIEGYIFPCFSCGNAAQQAIDTIAMLNTNGIQLNRLWVDIEGPNYWGSDQTANANFINQLINNLVAHGASVGIYTSRSQWGHIVGNSNSQFSSYPLWYAHYDNTASFNDFVPFAGWTKGSVSMKQYSDKGSQCGMGYDKNYKM